MTYVKVCGIKTPGSALAAARLGADLLGLVLALSPRQITVVQAGEISAAVTKEYPAELSSKHKRRPLLVGVFVNQPLPDVQRAVDTCGLDCVQLHGDENPEYCRELGRPFIKALRVAPGETAEELARRMDSYLAVYPEALFLLDTHVPGIYGGTGRSWDWERAARLTRHYPILVAGGLTPENVAGVVQAIRPWGVDVSSGVETDGQKDLVKVKAFVEAVGGADRQVTSEFSVLSAISALKSPGTCEVEDGD